MNEPKSTATATVTAPAFRVGFDHLADRHQAAKVLIGRVEASHRKGEMKRSTASSITLADGAKRTADERLAYKLRDAVVLLDAITGGELTKLLAKHAKGAAAPSTETAAA